MHIEQVIELASYFLIYSFIGWVLESTYKTIFQKKIVNSGFLHGPVCPIYGFGALIMFLFLEGLKGNPVLIFITGFLVLSIWEYLVGLFLEKVFHTKYWDYSNSFCNIKGRVCLLNSVFWGLLGLVFIGYIHPIVEKYYSMISMDIILYTNIALYTVLMVDCIISYIKVKNIELRIRKISEVSELLKQKIEELKASSKEETQANFDKLQDLVEELKQKQEKLNFRLYKYLIRLKKAFPTMESQKISDFLNEKMDLKRKIKEKSNELKQKVKGKKMDHNK